MKLYFHLPYKTAADESLRAVVFLRTAGKLLRKDVPMSSTDQKTWSGWAELTSKADVKITHTYQVLKQGQVVRQEWDAIPREAFLYGTRSAYHFYDLWRDLPEKSWLYSTAFPAEHIAQPLADFTDGLILRTYIPGLPRGLKPYLCGGHPALGNWDPNKALPMISSSVHEWAVWLDCKQFKTPAQYKYILKNEQTGEVQWETKSNRTMPISMPQTGETYVYMDFVPTFTLPALHAAGTVLPVFSIRTENDWGVGDFGSLKKLVDWAAETGQKMIQILPVNDTSLTGTWQDSYPYNSVSVYAFHPMYTDVSALPPLAPRKEKAFQKRRQKLNMLPQIDYEEVNKLKLERLHLAYEQEGKIALATAAFKEFWIENSTWLAAYAMFSVLRDKYGTADWQTWPDHKEFSEKDLFAFFAKDSKDREHAYFYFYVQFVLHTQLLEAHRYANRKGVTIKGDIPIGVSPHSADAWMEPKLFHLNAQAGAPPDDFSVTGQNWGFPTYNWEEMAKDGYNWWRRRFLHMTRYFDAYRIDHVLGFFRIWEIPTDAVQGLLGHFSPALPISPADMAKFGFTFEESYTRPYITEDIMQELFGKEAKSVKKHYLKESGEGLYVLREEYDTQRKIEKAFAKKHHDDDLKLRDGLYTLVANVLFVADKHNPQLYHPRISALNSLAYKALPENLQKTYEALYNDFFFRRQDDFWKQQALAKLPALTQATPMLCCAEDLGMIPHCVPEVLVKLQMLSLEIQRMPKRMGKAFARTEKYPYMSVATPSTHDMSVLRAWWKENPELTQRFWNEVLNRKGDAPAEAPVDACEQILRMHLQSPAMLTLISWQDWTSMDSVLHTPDPDAERINVPANPKHYWRYRMEPTVEELMQQTDFNNKIKEMIEKSGR